MQWGSSTREPNGASVFKYDSFYVKNDSYSCDEFYGVMDFLNMKHAVWTFPSQTWTPSGFNLCFLCLLWISWTLSCCFLVLSVCNSVRTAVFSRFPENNRLRNNGSWSVWASVFIRVTKSPFFFLLSSPPFKEILTFLQACGFPV